MVRTVAWCFQPAHSRWREYHTQERAGSTVLRKKPLRVEASLVCIFTLMELPQMSK